MIILEGYKIIKKIASGGMGDVYLAEHTVLETKVAIKSLHSNLVNDEDFRKRFKIEARVQAKLSHPNIVKLIDFQERKDGLYLVMEYVEGKQLDDYIREVTGPMPDEKLVPLFKEILSAIKYAHSKGLIHRDIKPSNILITAEGNAKIIDFGIAKSSDEDKGLTKTGVQVGTVSFMSPEQVRAKKLDLLTDIYSLGIMLFQMAVGQAPYSGQTNTFEIQLSIVSEPLPNAKDIYPSVSDKLVSIIEKATQKNKKDRFQSCDEFIKSFDKELVSKKIKSKSIKNLDKPLRNLKKTDSVKKKRKTSLFIYIVIGLISVLSITFLFGEDIKDKLYQDNLVKQVEDKYNNIEKIRLENLKKERLAKLEKDRLAKLEKDRLAKLEKERLAKLEKDRLAKLEKERLAKVQKEYSDGTYIGNFKNGLRHGKGKYSYTDGNIYEGYWKNDKKNGYGIFYWKNGSINDGDIYEGDFVNGAISGKGKLTWGNGGDFEGDIYEGDFLNNQRTGRGKYTWKESGDIYEGDYINGVETGKGKYTWKESGDIYEGDFINNVRTGKGKYTWKESGDIYEGDFINAAKSGKGKYTYKILGDVYEGDFVDLDFTGKGKYTWRNGDVYEGDFVNNYFTGKGKLTWGNGDVFVGDFNKDVKGKGRMYFKSSGRREFGEYNKTGEWKKR